MNVTDEHMNAERVEEAAAPLVQAAYETWQAIWSLSLDSRRASEKADAIEGLARFHPAFDRWKGH